MDSPLEVIAGTYEEFLLGYVVIKSDFGMKFAQSFATHAHTGSIRSVATAGRYLASGGADDKIIIHDLKTRTEHRVMMHHNGTVNSVAFTNSGSHLFSGSADGSMTATRTGNWQMEKMWRKAHEGSAIDHIAIHPSDKMALTLGGDHILRTWNLIKGRHAYATNLSSKGVAQASSVVWSPKGDQFALVGLNHIDIWTVSEAGVKKRLDCGSKCVSLAWITENVLVAGLESGELQINYLKSKKVKTFKAHDQRVKCIAFNENYMYSASSSGHIKMWKYDKEQKSLIEICAISTGCRITCITLNKHEIKPNSVETLITNPDVSHGQKRKLVETKSQRAYVSVTLSGDAEDSGEELPFVENSQTVPTVDVIKPNKKKKQKKLKLNKST